MPDRSEETFSDGIPVPDEPPSPDTGKSKGPTPAQQLLRLAENTYRLVRSDDGRAYAVPRLGAPVAVPLGKKSGDSLRARLGASLYRQTGQVASASALSDALNVLAGEASELDPVPVWLRAARHEDAVIIDMGTATGQCLVITPEGWSIETESPVIFRRSELIHPLPEPARGGTLEALRELINLTEEDYRLAVAWVAAAFLTGIPHPILLIQGEQGTAKSTLVRTLLSLVDPQPAAERHPPKQEREWAIFAQASWAFGFDNITEIPDWFSNALCKGVTGDAVLQRILHTDDDIGIYAFQRVIALNTIAIRHEIASDLADRMLLIEPEVIEDRLTEAEIRRRRDAALPGALAAILDLVSGVLRELPSVTVDKPPRMADFAHVLAAVDQVTGWDTLATYRARTSALALSLIEGNTLAYAIYRLATPAAAGQPDPGTWEGTASELLAVLRQICTGAGLPARDLPEDARSVGRRVREIAPSLRKAGVDVRTGRTGKRRTLRITRITAPVQEP